MERMISLRYSDSGMSEKILCISRPEEDHSIDRKY